MFFRVETHSTEVWDGDDSLGLQSSKIASPPGRAAPSLSGALAVAEKSARYQRSAFAAQFLRAYSLSTRGSCSPWPVNAYPLLHSVATVIIERLEAHDAAMEFCSQYTALATFSSSAVTGTQLNSHATLSSLACVPCCQLKTWRH
jgi:hypothetical protein